MLFQWFLIALSVRPGRCLAISAHLFPCSLCARCRVSSSSSVHGSFLIDGSSWLCQRSRHCLPLRPGRCLPMTVVVVVVVLVASVYKAREEGARG